jgi:hypothetical protein
MHFVSQLLCSVSFLTTRRRSGLHIVNVQESDMPLCQGRTFLEQSHKYGILQKNMYKLK